MGNFRFWIALFLATIPPVFGDVCPSEQRNKHVLFLFSYHVTQPMEEGFSQGVRSILDTSSIPVDLHYEYLDGKRYPPPTLDSQFSAILKSKYQNQCLDAILLADNIALDYTLSLRKSLFGNTPILFVGVNNFADSLLQGNTNITGIVEDIDIPGSFKLIRSLLDTAKTIYLLHDLTETGLRVRRETERLLKADSFWKPIWIDTTSYEELFALVSQPPVYAPLLLLTYSRDAHGDILSELELLRRLGTISKIPIFVLIEHQVQPGIMGGSLTSGKQHGQTAGKMLQQILAGTPADSIPIIRQSPKLSYLSHPSLVKYGIPLSSIPKNINIVDVPFSLWKTYRLPILGVILFILTLLLCIGVLLNMRNKLRISREEYRDLVRHASTIILRSNADGKILFINDFGLHLFGYTSQELIGKPLVGTIVPESDSAGLNLEELIHKIFEQPENFSIQENENQTKDGKRLWIRWHNRPQYDSNRTLESVFSVGTDITDKHNRDIVIAHFNNKVAHDLRSPLITISSFAGMIPQDLKDGNLDAVNTDIEYIQHAAKKMSLQLDELLQLSRIGHHTHKISRFNLNEVIEEARKLTAGRLEPAHIHFQNSVSGWIHGDRPRIVEVFQNLIDNAAKHMGTQSNPTISIDLQTKDNRKVIAIRDNGKGIESSQLEKIFELFYQIDTKSEGSGLGLSLVRRIVEAQGGRIWAESEGPQKGSTFYLMFDQMDC